MGLFEAVVKVGTLQEGRPVFTDEVSLLVDTGAAYSMIPSEVLQRAGIAKLGSVTIKLTDGTTAEKSFGVAVLEIAGHIVGANVLFGGAGDLGLLGVTSLELASLAVDPVGKRLVSAAAIQA